MTGLLASEQPLAAAYDLGLMDLDGVMYEGERSIVNAATGAAQARELGLQLMFVTNNSSRPAPDVARHLTELGIPATPEEVYSSAMAAVELALQRHGEGAKVLLIGGAGLEDAVAASSLVRVDSAEDAPVAVIQGLRKDIGWADLSEASFAIGRGADHIATNLDSTLPVERGLAIGNGSLVAAVVHATGVSPVSAGKPEALIYRLAAERVQGERPLAVGDRLNTDIRGSNASGIPSLHVLTGVSSAREVIMAVPEERPSYLGIDLTDLSLPHPPVTRDGEWVTCRSARVRIADDAAHLARDGGTFQLTEPATITLDEYRALAAAAWAEPGIEVPEVVVER
ncbi:MAG: HAD-IIA family hydrolase [bacterium]|nr:HAD-IIA family hydrolase [bacterium]